MPAVRRADPERPQGGRRSTSSSTSRTRDLLRRRGVRQVAVAGLRRSASPSTATAACRTSSSARRSRATAPGTRRTSRTRSTTSSWRSTSRRSTSTRSGRRAKQDPGAAARRDADHLRLLLLLPARRPRPALAGVNVVGDGPGRHQPGAASKALTRRHGRSRGGRPPSPASWPSAFALGLITLFLLSIVIFLARPGAAGRRGAAHPGPVRRPGVGRCAQQGARHRPPAARPSTGTGSRSFVHGRSRRRPTRQQAPGGGHRQRRARGTRASWRCSPSSSSCRSRSLGGVVAAHARRAPASTA